MSSVSNSILALLCILCIFYNLQITSTEKLINGTLTYETIEEAESKCIKEQWMYRCSNAQVIGLFTHEEISQIDSDLCGAIIAEQVFYICTNYSSQFFDKKGAIRECIAQANYFPIVWICKKSFS